MVVLSAVSSIGGKLSDCFCQRTSDGKRDVRNDGKLRGVFGACARACEKLTDSCRNLYRCGAVLALTRSARKVSMVMTRRLPFHFIFLAAADWFLSSLLGTRAFSTGESAPSQSSSTPLPRISSAPGWIFGSRSLQSPPPRREA